MNHRRRRQWPSYTYPKDSLFCQKDSLERGSKEIQPNLERRKHACANSQGFPAANAHHGSKHSETARMPFLRCLESREFSSRIGSEGMGHDRNPSPQSFLRDLIFAPTRSCFLGMPQSFYSRKIWNISKR